jgi:hypothetical protein
MRTKRYFQIFVLHSLLFSPLGSNQPIRASVDSTDELNTVVIDRNLDYWDNNYLGYASSSIYENWWLGLVEPRNFIVTVSPFLGDLVPLLILLDADGNELVRGIGTITSAQPAGDYSILVQPQTGAGFYFLLLREVPQTEPLTTILIDPSSLNVGETAVASVNLNNVPAEGYTSAEFTCFYDSNVVEVSNLVVPNRFGPDTVVAINGPQNNSFIVAIAGSHGDKATTSGTALTFDLKGLQAGLSEIECSARVSKGDKVLLELPSIGSRITVLGNVPTPTSTTAAAIPITIDPGQTTASRIGVINPNESIRYLLNATAGQMLSIKLTAPANEVAIGVNGPTGLVLKPLDASLTWNTTITTGGDHTITLIALAGGSSKPYLLEVSLTSPATAATPTTTPTLDPAFCDRVQLIADVTVPDGTNFTPGATFTKTWRLRNVGTCTWTASYQIVFFNGEQMGAPSAAFFPRSVASGQTVDISLNMTAPSTPGSYRGFWMFKNASGALFGIGPQANRQWWVDIRVTDASATSGIPSITPDGSTITSSPTVTPTFTQPSSILKFTKFASPQTYSGPDQTITYTFTITNMGTTALGPAQFTITDNKLGAPFHCGPAAVILAPNQSLSCSMHYKTTAADMELANITNSATASGADQTSAPATAVVTNLVVPVTPTPSITPGGPTATPIPSVVYDFAVNACSATWFSATAGELPCPGVDGDPRGFVFSLSNPKLESGTIDLRPGLLTFPQNIQNGHIQGVYPPFHVQNGDRFQATIGCEGGATNCYVAFRLDYQIGMDPIRTFWGPFLERYDGKSYSINVDLSSLAGKDVKFILTVLSAGIATGDRGLWVGPIIYRANAGSTPTVENPSTTTPTSTANDELTFTNSKYGFRFKYPAQGQIVAGGNDDFTRIDLPATTGTNLREKYLEVVVAENLNHCESPLPLPQSSEFITINSIPFLKETGETRAAGNTYKWTAFSTSHDHTCVSLGFILHSIDPSIFATPPPILYDEAAESTVFGQIVSTYTWFDITATVTPFVPTPTFTMTPLSATPEFQYGLLMGQVVASKRVQVSFLDARNHQLVTSWEANSDGTYVMSAPAGIPYTIVAKADGFLSMQGFAMIMADRTTTMPKVSLPAGDLDGNNVIDQFDALTIGINYNTAAPSVADLNNDGIINVLDLELLAQNYRKVGPVDWN